MQIKDEGALSAAIAGSTGPLRIVGGGSRTLGQGGDALEMRGLSGITLYEPGALTMVAQAGTLLQDVEAALAKDGQRLAFEPYVLGGGASTIGGVFATNASGPRRIQAGAARDFLLGVRFVDGRGRVIQNGGRVMKNVTGYDLVKLMAGSRGALGALSEVSFKVMPLPETEATLVLRGAPGVAAMARALASPYEVSGAAQGPLGGAQTPTYLRVEGFETSVRYRMEKLQGLLSEFGAQEVVTDPEASRGLWRGIRDVEAFAETPYLARMSIKPSDFDDLQSGLSKTFHAGGRETPGFNMMLDWGGGLVWVIADRGALVENGKIDPKDGVASDIRGAQLLHAHLQEFGTERGGHATLMRAPEGLIERVSICQPEAPGVARLTAGLRAEFDPMGRFAGQSSAVAA